MKGVRIERFQHWAVGWVKQILVHEDAEKALDKARDLEAQTKDYPVLDEEDYSKRRSKREGGEGFSGFM